MKWGGGGVSGVRGLAVGLVEEAKVWPGISLRVGGS
jgi:hypothetical protein